MSPEKGGKAEGEKKSKPLNFQLHKVEDSEKEEEEKPKKKKQWNDGTQPTKLSNYFLYLIIVFRQIIFFLLERTKMQENDVEEMNNEFLAQ